MRIWSIHPQYLDTKGLTAVWRETLLAKHVLEGKTVGYKHHPQLKRFKEAPDPLKAIHYYLQIIYKEATERGFHYDHSKFENVKNIDLMPVTSGQMSYEKAHLMKKLEIRDPEKYKELRPIVDYKPHPLFYIIDGKIEEWELV